MDPILKPITELNGTKVINLKGEELGDIKDVAFDLDAGKVAYAVLSFGGFLGFGDKYFAVPWDSMILDQKREQIILDVDKEKLENAPGFDKDNWPDKPNKEFIREVYAYYGFKPYWDREEDELASKKYDPSNNSGLGNSGEHRNIKNSGFGTTRIEESGIK